jgi:RNA polymerase sigma-70 factor, ECF subfamily
VHSGIVTEKQSGPSIIAMEMTPKIELSDDRLLRQMLAGDELAFTELYRRRHPAIYRFALHMSGNPAMAEDVTQEVFMALIREPGRFDATRGSLSAFLFGIARNHLRKRWEQERRLIPIAGEPDEVDELIHPAHGNGNGHSESHSFVNEFESRDTVGLVRRAISTLPASYREVVILCELEEMSYEEAAATLECPVGTIRSRLHRGRAILLEKLRETRSRPASVIGKAAGRQRL